MGILGLSGFGCLSSGDFFRGALAEGLRDQAEELARLITEENGKSLPDSRAEVKRALENTEVACGMPVLGQGDKLIGGAVDIDGEVIRLPVGTFGMIAPFNFPMMVPFWFFPYALATGNTYVVKPSEQTSSRAMAGGLPLSADSASVSNDSCVSTR